MQYFTESEFILYIWPTLYNITTFYKYNEIKFQNLCLTYVSCLKYISFIKLNGHPLIPLGFAPLMSAECYINTAAVSLSLSFVVVV